MPDRWPSRKPSFARRDGLGLVGRQPAIGTVPVAILLGLGATFTMARPMAAECTAIDPWASFTEAARSAKRIVVGEVIESYGDDSADNAIESKCA
jgi:hypothetical protein